MNVAKRDLDEWRVFCSRMTTALCAAEGALASGSVDQARELLWSAQDASARMGMKLEIAGAESNASNSPVDHSPARQWYALMLRDAWDAARQLEDVESDQGGASKVLRLLLKEVEEELYAT